jgi:Contractile injection system tape measure protein
MTIHPDIIGKCLFEIDIPDRNKEVWVYDQVSKLAHAQLEVIFAAVFEQLGLSAQTRIQIDRIEIDLGNLPEVHFDTVLLTAVQRELTQQLQQYLEPPPYPPKDRLSYIVEALTFFLQHGRLPWWVSREEAAGSIDLFFKELWTDYPGAVKNEFRSWSNLPHSHQRLAQQLPADFLKEILPLLGKNDARKITEWLSKTLAQSKNIKGKTKQQLEDQNLNSPTTPSSLFVIPDDRTDSVPTLETTNNHLTAQDSNNVPDSFVATPIPLTAEAHILLHYLERGSFPNGIDRSHQQLNSIILQLIQENPNEIKQWLLLLFKKANPTARLAQQFSVAVQVALLQLFYPKYWPEMSAILTHWAKALPKNTPQKVTLDALYKMSLLQLLPTVSPHPDIPQFLQYIAAQISQRLGIDPQELADILHNNPVYNATERQHIQRALQRLQPDEQVQLETELQQWSSFDTAEDLAATAIDRILYRLEQGTTAWWDDSSQSLDQLVLQLTTLPSATRREAFVRLFARDIRAQWLPIVSEQTFEQVLYAFWGDYASLVALLATALNTIALEKGTTITMLDWREAWLSWALSTTEIDSKSLIYKSLSYFPTQDTTLAAWKKSLSDYSNNALATGDIRFNPISSALRDEANWEDIVQNKALESATKHILEDAGVAIESHLTQSATDTDLPNSGSFPDLIRAELAAIWRFLQKGVLARQTVLASQQDLQQSLQRLLSQYPKLVLPLLQKAMERPAAIARLLDYFPEKTWLQLGTALFHPHFETILSVRASLLHQWQGSLTTDGRHPVERSFWSYIFTTGNVEVLVRAAKKMNPDTAAAEDSTPDAQHFAIVFTEGWLAAVSQVTQLPQDVLWQSLQPHPAQENQSSLLQKIWPELHRRRQQTLVQVATKNQRQNPTSGTGVPEDTLLIGNAGLVILAPYLPHYFEQLGMLENRVFKDAAAAERGVHLLQYLASRQSETPEQHLVFNKMLCGLPLESPVNAGIELSENEISISQSLLEAILQRWEIMKNSTVSNFCGAFLLREGILLEQHDRWVLHVENKAYDIVLEYLPWTISIIKLPWMDKRLEVVWKKKN